MSANLEEHEEKIKVLQETLFAHERANDILSQNYEMMGRTVNTILEKVDELVEGLSSQKVLIERISNIDENIKEGFSRRDEKIKNIESQQQGGGCPPLKALHDTVNTNTVTSEKLEKKIDRNYREINEKIGSFVSGTVMRWAISLLTTGLIAVSIVYNSADKDLDKKIEKIAELNNENASNIQSLLVLNSQYEVRLLKEENDTVSSKEQFYELKGKFSNFENIFTMKNSNGDFKGN